MANTFTPQHVLPCGDHVSDDFRPKLYLLCVWYQSLDCKFHRVIADPLQ